MKIKLFNKLFVLQLIMIFLFLAACSDSSNTNHNGTTSDSDSGSVEAGGSLKIAIDQNVTVLAPSSEIRAQVDAFVSETALEKLGRYKSDGTMEPVLAESWEENPDELSITFELKQGIKFHDGTDFNAEAVKWNIEEFMNAGRTELEGITSVEVTGEHTVQIHLDEWNSSMLNNMIYFVPMVSPAAYEENGIDWIKENPIGTGPYKLESWTKDESIVFTKNEDYWQEGKPSLDSIEFYIYADSSTAAASLQAGEIDAYVLAPALVANDMSALEEFVITQNETGLGALGLGVIGDSADPDSPFSNELVRRAVSLAIDREAIVQSLLYGYAIPTNQWGIPGSLTYNDNLEIEYNPKKAKELLAEAGYPDGFKTVYNVSNAPEQIQQSTAIQEYLSEIGIEAELNVMDTGLFREVTIAANNEPWEGLIQFNSRGDYDLTTYMPRNFSPEGTLYSHHITFKDDVLALFDELKGESDRQVIQEKSYELQRLVAEEYAIATFIYVTSTPAIIHQDYKDTGINTGHGSEWTPENAYMEK